MSKFQAKGHYIQLKGADLSQAKLDISNNITFNDFIKKYPNTLYDRNLLILKTGYNNYDKKDIVKLFTLPLGPGDNKSEHYISPEDKAILYKKEFRNKWIIQFSPGSSYYPEQTIFGFYFTEEFKEIPLKNEYSRLVQYVDCIVDTNTTVFNKIRDKSGNAIAPKEVDSLFNYINLKAGRPVKFKDPGKIAYKDLKAYNKWLDSKNKLVEDRLSKTIEFNTLLGKAINASIAQNTSNEDLEVLAEKYYSPKKALQLKRNRQVYGTCSEDLKPRQHTMKIATLAAETHNWNVFIRAHLDIMNDRFERISDNSLSASRRQTYIKELESLNINVPDLLLGMCFQVENPFSNHYFANASKIGKSLSESNNADSIENRLVNYITDKQLDDFNRAMFYYVYNSYISYLKDGPRKDSNLIRLSNSVEELPECIKVRVNSDNYEFEQVLKEDFPAIKRNFDIYESCVGSCGHTYRDEEHPNTWSAELHDKTMPKSIYTNVIIGYNDKPMSISPLIEHKDAIFNAIKSVHFIFDTINQNPKYHLEFWYVNGFTFPLLAQDLFLKSLPTDLVSDYSKNLDKVILFEYHKPSSVSNWLYFPNGGIMLWNYEFDVPVTGYNEKQLVSDDRKYSGYEPRACYKIFDKNGKLMKK